MTKQDCFLYGMLLKPHGIEGQLIIKFDIALEESILETMELIFIEIDNGLVPFFLEKNTTQQISNNSLIIKFDDVDDEVQARELCGKNIWLLNKYKQNVEKDIHQSNRMKNFTIISQNNQIVGKITDLLEYPQNPLYVVQSESNEILIPANKNLITQIDFETKKLFMNLPDGLINLN